MKISKITLGTVQLGMPYGINNQSGQPSDQRSSDILSAAWNGGVVSYDTAAAYGESERIVGQYFRDGGKEPTLITKLSISAGRSDSSGSIEYEMRSKAEASLSNLQLNKIPILMLHNTEVLTEHGEAVTAGFLSLQRAGLIEEAGISISTNSEHEFTNIWGYLQHEAYSSVQLPMNVLDHRPLNNGCLSMLHKAGKQVFVRSAFLQGLLFMEDHQLPPHLSAAAPLLHSFRGMAARYGMSLSQIAISFIRDLEGVNSIVAGAETPEQVRDNLRLIEGPALPDALRAEIMTQFSDVSEFLITPALWNQQSR